MLVIEPPGGGYAQIANELLHPSATIVIRLHTGEIESAIRQLQRTALTGSEEAMDARVESFASILRENGFRPERSLEFEEVLVVAQAPVPIELTPVGGVPLGLQVVISQFIAPNQKELRALLESSGNPEIIVLQRAALLAIASLRPTSIRRQDHDIIKAALRLSDRIPTDILIEPAASDSLRYFARKDIQILHVDTHGTPDSIQLGTLDRSLGSLNRFPSVIGPSFILLVGCLTGSARNSLGPALTRRGARSVLGIAFEFRSGAPSGDDISDPKFYDSLWEALLQGVPVGQAVLRAKQALPRKTWSAVWLLFGNPDLKFSVAP